MNPFGPRERDDDEPQALAPPHLAPQSRGCATR
jgi:hypothetical protein